MSKENNPTQVTEENLAFIEKELEGAPKPLVLHEINEKLAFHKTASQRVQDVLKYDPSCKYEVGDQVYKDYDESLTVSSKTVEHFKGAVVLKVVNKVFYKSYQCEMLEVDYTGGGIFRKYIDYMKKTRTQVLLPSNCDGQGLAPETLGRAEDPRLCELPMTDKDMKALEKNLRAALTKSDKFFNWLDYWQLSKNQVAIPEDKVKAIEQEITEAGQSKLTAELVTRHFGLEPSHDLFDITCISLNVALDKKHKKEFVFVSPGGWGKWHLKSILNSYLQGLPLSAPPVNLPEGEGAEKPQLSTFHEFPLKIYLTWREVLSGGVRVPRTLNKELAHAREYTFTDAEEGKSYTVYYYPTSCFFLGLKDYYQSYNIPQGTSLTLEKKGPYQFNFWLKKSKKKIAVPQLSYDAALDRFGDTGTEVFTYALPNKIIFLEKDTLGQLLPLYEEREGKDLHELLLTAFKTFGLESEDHSLHFLRAYHLVDVLRQTTQEDVETTLINSTEFTAVEKKKGIFSYQEPMKVVEEAALELPAEAPAAEAAAPEETASVEISEEIVEPEPITVPPPVPTPPQAPAKPRAEGPAAPKGKPAKKKRGKGEGERGPKPRKSERRVIEERIELAESEQEALAAVKVKETAEGEEAGPREKKEEIKPAAAQGAAFGFFADKLKSALQKKRKEDVNKEDAGKEDVRKEESGDKT
jgi:hypothetical protein